jgi:hypothetical protein
LEDPVPRLLEVIADFVLHCLEYLLILVLHHLGDYIVGLVKLELEFFPVCLQSSYEQQYNNSNSNSLPDNLVLAREAGEQTSTHFVDKQNNDYQWG